MKYLHRMAVILLTVILSLGMVTSSKATTEANNKELVPLRFICEAQGATVNYSANTVVIKKDKQIISLKPATGEAKINEKEIDLADKIEKINGRILVPLSFINEALGINLTMEDCIKILAVKYVDLIKQDSISDCMVLCDNYLRETTSASKVLKQMGLTFKSLAGIKQLDIKVSKNALHQNVRILYDIGASGQFNYTVRFDYEGKIDDCMFENLNPNIPYKTPEYEKSENFTESEVVIGDGEWKLPGTLTLPKGEGPFPVVVLVHGSGPNDRDETLGPLKPFRDLAVGLAAKKIAVLRYEKRSLEHNFKFAAIEKLTVKDETITDAIAAVNFLSKLKEVDSSRIYVIGHSQGAMLMPRILKADTENKIKGAVMMSGNARSLMDVMLDQFQYLSGLKMATLEQMNAYKNQFDLIKDPTFSPDNPPTGFVLGTPYWWADLKAYEPTKSAMDIVKPLLILQGERDYQVSATKDFQVWKDALANKANVRFMLYPKLNHMYTEGIGELSTPTEYYTPNNIPLYVIDDISKWMDETGK